MPTLTDMYPDATIYDPMQQTVGTTATQTDTQSKTTNLQNKVQEKLGVLSAKKDTILGMSDADTVRLQSGALRESPSTGQRYDAVELQHGNNPYDMYGTNSKAEGEYGKSKYAMDMQRVQVAKILGKPADQLTPQDMIDVGNQQQVQKLADLVASPGEAKWEAPLIRNAEQTNLTGYYKDSTGQSVQIPLDVPVGTAIVGKDANGRDLSSLVNLQTGQNVTDIAATDPRQNAFANQQNGMKAKVQTPEQQDAFKQLMALGDRSKSTDRSWGDAVKDTGLQVVVGSENTVKNLADIYGVATGDMNNYVSTWMDQASKWTSDKYSPALKAAAQDKASKVAEGKTELDKFVIATKENFKNPMLISQLVTESAPMMVAALAAGEGMAAASGISALEGMLSAAAIQQGVDMGREVYDSFLHVGPGQKVFQKDWDNNPKYQELIANGATSEEAKHEIALTTARGVSLASGLLSYGVNRFMPGGHAIEEKLVGLGSKGTGIAKALVGESATEGIEEGGGKAFQNIGLQEVNQNVKTEQDVGVTTADAMAAGGATAGIMKSPELLKGSLGTVGTVADVVKKGVELATETDEQKAVRENMTYTAPLKAEAEVGLTTGATDDVVSKVEAIHGKLTEDLDESAPKAFTYGRVIRDALTKAAKNEDTDAIKNIYKTIAELDSREDVDFKAKDVIDERTYEATKQFKDLINSNESTESKLNAMKLGKQVAAEADATVKTTGAQMDANILEKVKSMKASLEQDIKDMKDVMGSDQFNENSKGPKELVDLIDMYISGKGLDTVNAEMSKLGYIELDPSGGLRADPNRPGVQTYARELESALLNPKANKNLLDEKVTKAGGTTLTGLERFANSRLEKLNKDKAYQTSKLLGQLINENSQILEVIQKLQKTASGLKGIKANTKSAYETVLDNAYNATKTANEQMVRRQEILSKLGKSANGQYAYQIDKAGNETIQLVNGKDRQEVAKVTAEGTVEWIDDKFANREIKTTAKAVPDESVNKEEYYAEAKFKDNAEPAAETKVEPAAKEQVVIEPTMESKPDEVINKEDYKAQAKFTEPVKVTETKPADPKDPLRAVRENIVKLDETLSAELAKVKDMDVKQHIKDYYAKKLDEINADKTKLNSLFDRIEKAVDARLDRLEGISTKNPLAGLIAYADKLIKSMLNKLDELRNKLRLNKNQFDTAKAELNDLLGMINTIEQDYLDSKGIKPEVVKTSIGKVTKYTDTVYGKPMIETKDKRVEAVQKKTSKGLQTPETALNQAMAELVDESIAEYKAQGDSLSAKIMVRNLENFHISSAVHRMISQGQDSIFGKLGADLFSNPKKLLEALPKSFKEFFVTDEQDGKDLIENFKTMDKFINGVTIGDIHMTGEKITGNIDKQGLVIKYADKYVAINRPIEGGDKLQSADGKTLTVKADKSNIPTNLEGYKVKSQLDTSFPVDILELIGTIKDGKLEIDEQTKTVLKFYSAKMIIDTQAMVGNILSMDAGDMSKYLGITDPTEQEEVKLNAANGLVSSAAIRKDIGSEVYQALGIRLGKNTPEFTEESFESALGVLVQAIAVDNGTMDMQADEFGGKNQNLISVNKAMIESDELLGIDGNNALIKAMNKLQYLNENRNRPLPSFNKLAPVEDGKRFVMNTRMPIDNETNAKMNKTEEIAYTISDRLYKYLAMPEEDVLKMMGYKDVENSGLHISEQSAQQARNDKLVREWNILKTFAKAAKGKKFYIPWGQTVSGRYTMLSDLQYQESKLHREFVVADNKEETVDVNNADNVQMMKASILQGLDMDPDKLSPETASAKFDETFKVTDKGLEVIKDGPIKEAYEAVRDGKFNIEAMAEVFDDSEGHHGLSSIELLVEWDKAIKGKGKLKTASSVEIDAITSGMILTLLQIGTDKAIQMAEKGGIYTAERMPALKEYVKHWLGDVTFTPGALIEAGKKHAAEIEDKMKTATGKELIDLRIELENDAVFKDLYSTIGVAMIGEVQAYKDMLVKNDARTESEDKQLAMLNQIGELNLKNIRSIAKSPVMVYIYGASISSIKKKLTYSLGVDTVVKAIKKASKLLEDGKDATAELEFIDQFIPVKRYKDLYGMTIDTTEMSEADKLLHLEVDEKSIEDIGKVIDATFGTAIESAFESRLGFVDKNRDAVKSVEMLTFEAYKIKFSEAVKAKLIEKYGLEGAKKGSMALSKDDLVDINNRLIDEGYGHTIVWNQDGRVRNQSLQKTADKGGIHSSRVRVGDTTVGGQIKESKPIVNTGAASTIPIHAIDGEMIMETLNRELKGELAGKYTGGNVYDAVVLGLNKALLTDTADYYNTGMIETGFSRSIMADQLDKLEKMLSGLVKDGLINKFTDAIGLRPKGDGAFDYAKEANRLGLSVSKMLERIELAEQLNNERLVNSTKAYGSGHLYQMGSGVVDVKSADETRAKEFPAIARIKAMLKKVIERDRAKTAEEFKDKIADGVDYVLNLNDFIKGANTTESKANLAQFKLLNDKLKVSDKLWSTLTSKDAVQVIGDLEVVKEALKDAGHGKSAKWHLDNIMKELGKTDANVIGRGFVNVKTTKPLEENNQRIDLVVMDNKLSIKDKMYQLIAVYKDQDAPKIGGGLVEDVTRKSVYDEDAKAATMMKGVQDSTLKDMLPKVDGKTINSYERAVNAWYKDMKRGIAIQNKLTEFTELIKTIEYSPELMEELGWSKDKAKQEADIIVPTETFEQNVNRKIECKE